MTIQNQGPDALSDSAISPPPKSGNSPTSEELMAILQQALKDRKEQALSDDMRNSALGQALAHTVWAHRGDQVKKPRDPVTQLQHDLRGPLNVLQVLVESLNQAPDHLMPHHLEMLGRNVRRLVGLVDDLPQRLS